MAGAEAHIEIYIDVEEPIELDDFVTAFTSLSLSYRRYMRHAYPDSSDDAHIFVKQVRQGSIIADLIPAATSLIGHMDQVLIVEQFIRAYGDRLGKYFYPGGRAVEPTKTELDGFMDQVAAIAKSKNGKGTIRAVTFEDGERLIKAAVEFNVATAVTAIKEIEDHKKELDATSSADHERVLMTFKRSDIGSSDVGVRSGERVIIEDISEKDFALIYASNLAEQKIKDQMRNTAENIYHKGFVVDVNVATRRGRPVAYSVTHLHSIIDLPEDD